MKSTLKKVAITSLSIIICIYIGILSTLYFKQKSLLYFPNTKDFYNCTTFKNSEQRQYNNTRFYQQDGNSGDVIIFFHGNAGRACDRSFLKHILEATGHSIIFVEYYGYAQGDKHTPNINNILQDVENIGKYVQNQNYSNTYIIGRSLGTGPASYYAKLFLVSKLFLISPYSQLYKVAADKYPIFPIKFLFTENYSSEHYLKNYSGHVHIVHGTKDKVIPYKFGKDLYDTLANKKKSFQTIQNGTHHDLLDRSEVHKQIIDFFGRKELYKK